jgi:hypothetical protein
VLAWQESDCVGCSEEFERKPPEDNPSGSLAGSICGLKRGERPMKMTTISVPTSSIPKNSTLVEAYETPFEVVVIGDPIEGLPHNCDDLGCSSVGHVRYRLSLSK